MRAPNQAGRPGTTRRSGRDGRHAAAREALFALDDSGTLATCAIIDLGVGYSARNLAEYESIDSDRRALYLDLPITMAVCRRAKNVQHELLRRGQHRGPGVPDLLIAACAELNDAVMVHYDHDFDTIATITGQPVRWLVPAGSTD
jgi:predicted nucleic acid-binding protein